MKFPTLIGALLVSLSAHGASFPALQLEGSFDLHAQTVSTPVVAQGKLLLGAEDGNLYALDLATRKLAWLFKSWGGIGSTPAVADGIVYVLGRDGVLHALDVQSGEQRWEFATQGESRFAAHGLFGTPKLAAPARDAWDFYLSSPVVGGGKVYFGSSDERLYALDARSGAVQWVFKSGGMIHAKPALADGKLVFGSWDGAVYALDAASGKQLWRYQTETEQQISLMFGVQAPALIDGATVYIGSRDGYFYALELASGRMKWRYDGRGSWIVSGAVADASNVYFGTSDTNLLVALDKRSGKPVFEHDAKVWTYATPLLVGDAVVGASMRGELFALRASDGHALWSWRTPESLADEWHTMDASGKFDSKRLFDAPHTTHEALEHVKRLGAFLGSPLWHDGRLIVATADGRVLFFR